MLRRSFLAAILSLPVLAKLPRPKPRRLLPPGRFRTYDPSKITITFRTSDGKVFDLKPTVLEPIDLEPVDDGDRDRDRVFRLTLPG